MRLFVVLSCFLAGCLAQNPYPCRSPPFLSGELTVSTQNEKLFTYAKYLYDAPQEKIRLLEIGTYQNKTFTYDILLLYKESVMYEIHDHNRTCKKLPLKREFHPMEVPKDASLMGQVVLGSSSGPGQGLLVNSWTGEVPVQGGKYIFTVTEFGCIPISNLYHTDQFGWMLTSLFNIVVGISDPTLLNPPDFCPDAKADDEEPVDLYRLFRNMH